MFYLVLVLPSAENPLQSASCSLADYLAMSRSPRHSHNRSIARRLGGLRERQVSRSMGTSLPSHSAVAKPLGEASMFLHLKSLVDCRQANPPCERMGDCVCPCHSNLIQIRSMVLRANQSTTDRHRIGSPDALQERRAVTGSRCVSIRRRSHAQSERTSCRQSSRRACRRICRSRRHVLAGRTLETF